MGTLLGEAYGGTCWNRRRQMAMHRLPVVIPLNPALPTSRFVILTHLGPLTSSDGPNDYACGKCGNVLLAAVEPGCMGGTFIRCGACSAYNFVPSVAAA